MQCNPIHPRQSRRFPPRPPSSPPAELGHDPRNYFRDLSAIPQADYFGHRAILARQKPPKPLEGFVKRCVLKSLLLLLAASSLQAEQVPSTPASEAIFLWLAGGISSARIQRLAQTPDEALKPSCHATSQCTRALQKAGADAGLIQSLGRQNRDRKPAATAACDCACASPAAQIAALVHDKKFDAAEDKIRILLRDDAGDASPNSALLQFVLGTMLR